MKIGPAISGPSVISSEPISTTKTMIMTLTKRELVVRISEETGLVQTQVFDVVQKTLNYITEALAKGDKVELRNFGVFDVKIRKARVGRNPNRPETDVPIPARAMVKFKAGKEMRAEVLKLTPKK
jgi:nucleoid DNA-binding protein